MLRSWSETAPWQSREVSIVLPSAVASAMWERARKWDVEAGGRFDTHSGSIFVHWRSPTDDQATIYAVAWDPDSGGSAEEMLQAVNLLAGQLVAV
jgi:hypothetical protein